MELKIQNITKRYRDKTAVDDVSITLTPGVWGLLGANGAGKTTLMRMLAGILRPSSGRILCDGVEIGTLGAAYREKLGYLPQEFGFYPEFTVQDYLEYMAALKGLPRTEAARQIDALLERVSLTEVRCKKIIKLSGGMKRRVGIAQALLNDPEILILDEPTAGLDPGERVRFRNLLSEFAQERIVLISTHIVSDVEYIAAENAVMKAGKIIAQDTTEGLVKQIEAKVWQGNIPMEQLARWEYRLRVVNLRNEPDGTVTLRYLADAPQLPDSVPAQPRLEVSVAVPGGNGGSKMNLYRLELKRVCKTRMTAILLAIALVLAVVMAYLPVTFIGWTELDASGNEVRYTGLKAIRKRQEQQVSGTITPDVMQEALEAYQRVYRQHDASSINDIPVEVFYKELARYQPLVNNAKEAFADPKTGMAPGVMGLTAEDMQNFYSQLPKRLESVIWLEQSGKPGYEQAQAIAQKKFDAVQKPFTYSFGVSSDAMDYQTLLSLLLTLLCAVIAAPVFASDAQTGAQDIQLCTKNGGLRLAAAKLAAAFSITGAAYLLCGVVWILVTNALFGWESTQTSVQWLFSVTSLLPYTVGQMEWVMLVANFLIFFAEVAFVLMASVWAKNNLTALSVALISVVAPLIVYMVVPGSFGEWLSTLIPAGGIGLSNALLYKMISFDFLYAGGHAFFQADVLLASAPIKIVLLVGLAAWGYLRKTKVA